MDVEGILQEWFEVVSSASNSSKALVKLANENAIGENELADAMVEAYGIDAIGPIASLVVSQLTYLQSLNLEEDVFYSRLWCLLSESVLFNTDEMKMQALGIAITCPGMPYRRADIVSMSDEEYAERQQALGGFVRDMIDMLNRRFSQKTETASAVLEVIEKCDERSDRVVLMSVLLESVKSAPSPLIIQQPEVS